MDVLAINSLILQSKQNTGGSIRHPATVYGLYGMGPTFGTAQNKGFVCTTLINEGGISTELERRPQGSAH